MKYTIVVNMEISTLLMTSSDLFWFYLNFPWCNSVMPEIPPGIQTLMSMFSKVDMRQSNKTWCTVHCAFFNCVVQPMTSKFTLFSFKVEQVALKVFPNCQRGQTRLCPHSESKKSCLCCHYISTVCSCFLFFPVKNTPQSWFLSERMFANLHSKAPLKHMALNSSRNV